MTILKSIFQRFSLLQGALILLISLILVTVFALRGVSSQAAEGPGSDVNLTRKALPPDSNLSETIAYLREIGFMPPAADQQTTDTVVAEKPPEPAIIAIASSSGAASQAYLKHEGVVKVVSVGAQLGEWRIVDISSSAVTFEYDGETIVRQLFSRG
ncbi:MAG: hypothetical protein CMK06_05745 [Ponticaulis sp.]|nr:hypothetical protein [Ponticaulis sp.]